MRILLTGGSGTVGKEVLKLLSKNSNYEVVAFDVNTRHSRSVYKDYEQSVTVIYGDLTNASEVQNVCQGVDFVIHLAAIIPPLADEKPALAERVNVKGTRNLIRSLEKYSPDAFFLYSSSVSVYGDRLQNHFIKVGDELKPSFGDEYAVTKLQAEKLIQESKLNWSIFRLSAIIGFNNHKPTGLMFHMPLQTKMEITTPSDTARAFVNSIGKEQLLNKSIFNLGGGEHCRITYGEFLSNNFAISGLGKLDFPPNAFAEKNFHCGYYADGNELESIVGFRNTTLEDYWRDFKATVPAWKRFATSLFSPLIKKYLTSLSEPLEAVKGNDKPLIDRFFNSPSRSS